MTELQENGNILEYVRRVNPSQDRRIELVGTSASGYSLILTSGSLQAHDIASGLANLHSLKPAVCHGDIKPVGLFDYIPGDQPNDI